MRLATAIRHVAFEDLGLLGPILHERDISVGYVEAPAADLGGLDPLAPDLLVVLGGPIGAYEDHLYPFLKAEIALIERRLAAGRPTLGLCLGAQLMARALGARVYPAAGKELGWAPVALTDAGRRTPLQHLDGGPVLHWHGDTFDLPAGATRLASTPVCENQAFSCGTAALALQFHAEAAGPALESWFVGHASEIATTPGVDVPRLRADTKRFSPGMVERGQRLFGHWLDGLG